MKVQSVHVCGALSMHSGGTVEREQQKVKKGSRTSYSWGRGGGGRGEWGTPHVVQPHVQQRGLPNPHLGNVSAQCAHCVGTVCICSKSHQNGNPPKTITHLYGKGPAAKGKEILRNTNIT